MPDGSYVLGGLEARKKGKECRLAENQAIAGSVTNLPDCLRTAVLEMGIPLEQAIAAATINAARAIGEDARYGSIEPGKAGNIILLRQSPALELQAVILRGEVLK